MHEYGILRSGLVSAGNKDLVEEAAGGLHDTLFLLLLGKELRLGNLVDSNVIVVLLLQVAVDDIVHLVGIHLELVSECAVAGDTGGSDHVFHSLNHLAIVEAFESIVLQHHPEVHSEIVADGVDKRLCGSIDQGGIRPHDGLLGSCAVATAHKRESRGGNQNEFSCVHLISVLLDFHRTCKNANIGIISRNRTKSPLTPFLSL